MPGERPMHSRIRRSTGGGGELLGYLPDHADEVPPIGKLTIPKTG